LLLVAVGLFCFVALPSPKNEERRMIEINSETIKRSLSDEIETVAMQSPSFN
jgi:hypothetical protein